MSSSPLLDKPVQLTATFTINERAQKDIQDLDIEFILPEGFQLVEGSLTGKVKVLPDTPSQYQATIKAVKTGIWQIDVKALYPWPDFIGGKGSARGELYANISETSAEVSDVPLGPKIGHGGPDTSPPKGWVPPPGYEKITPVPASPPPANEPPPQDVPPVDVPSLISP